MKTRRKKHRWDATPIASRAWTREERRVVLRGFFGRLTIAIEPFLVGLFLAFLPIGMWLGHQETALMVAPIFGLVAIAFVSYSIFLMVPSTRAVFETMTPIFIVDGYVRYRESRASETSPVEYHVAVLNADREVLGEWGLREWPASIGTQDLWAALVEFSLYGGIHKIDGLSTGVLPSDIAPFGIGIARDAARRDSNSR